MRARDMIERGSLAAVAAAFVLAASGSALADEQTGQQLAQALFDEGRALMDQGRYAEACPKLAESQRLDPGGGTILNLAIYHEREGKLATARSDFEESLRIATKDGRADRERIAREHLAGIEALIPRISVVVSASAQGMPGLEVKLDGVVLRREAWGVATPVDPGAHVVEATATDRAPWSSTVNVAKSERKEIVVGALAPLTALPASRRDASTAPASGPRTNPVFLGLVGGVGIAGAASLVTGLVALLSYASAKSGCLPEREYCKDAEAKSSADRASTFAWISTISLGAAVGAGVIALFVPPRIAGAPAGPRVGVTSHGATIGVGGRF